MKRNIKGPEPQFVFGTECLRSGPANEFAGDQCLPGHVTYFSTGDVSEERAVVDFSVPSGPGAGVFPLNRGIDGGGRLSAIAGWEG